MTARTFNLGRKLNIIEVLHFELFDIKLCYLFVCSFVHSFISFELLNSTFQYYTPWYGDLCALGIE